jgi:hypothetical protein
MLARNGQPLPDHQRKRNSYGRAKSTFQITIVACSDGAISSD